MSRARGGCVFQTHSRVRVVARNWIEGDILSDGSARRSNPQTYAIIGAAMEVHRHLGAGFLEAVYQEALRREFAERGVSSESDVSLRICYKGLELAARYRADLVCYGEVIVELKAVPYRLRTLRLKCSTT